MKNKRQIIKPTLLFLVLTATFGTTLFSQPKYHSVPKQMMQDINMNNTSSPIITGLPYHLNSGYSLATESYWMWNRSDDTELQAAYEGNTPLFAHQVVNDKDGNLLFFIVDNYIYNKYGYGFDNIYGPDLYHTVKDSYNPHDPSLTEENLYHNIIVVPVPGSCNEYFMFYSMLNDEKDQANYYPKVYYKKITFINETEISVTTESQLSLPNLTSACNDCNGFSMTITPYNDTYEDYLLVVQWLDQIRVFEIEDAVNPTCVQYNPRNVACDGAKRPDAVLTIDDNGDVVLIHSSTQGDNMNAFPVIRYYRFTRDFSNLSSNGFTQGYIDYNNNYVIRGMETSPNNDYLYVTFQDLNGVHYFNISSFMAGTGSIPTSYSTLNPTGDYTDTEIETFSNGKLYLISHNSTYGTYTSINSPNSPSTTTFSYSCFSGLQVIKTQLISDVSSYDRYAFNHQIDASDYEELYPSVCCNQPDWSTIGSTATWSPGVGNNPFRSETGVVYFDDDFEIPTGKYITLSNMEFHFPSSKNAIINTNATLRLIGSALTSDNSCDENVMWDGVEILGNSTLDQSTANQGRLRMDAGSEISNAYKGVRVDGGGICQIYAGDFINNRYGIYVESYTHPTVPTYNASFISNATFTTNKALNNGTTPLYMVILQSVKDVDITNCTFENTRGNDIASDYRGYGIRALYTDFVVNNCDINGLRYGSYINYGTPKITNCDFTNNFRGAYFGSSTNVEVTGNDFDGDISFTPSSGDPYSTYIGGNGSSNTLAKYEENTITDGTIGAYFYNLGPNPVKVKDNTFTSISGASNACAAVAKGKNSDFVYLSSTDVGEEGLEFRCNSFDDNPYALSVIDGNMKKYQGDQNATTGSGYAGNEFDHWGTNSERDFYVDQTITSSLDIPLYTYYSHSDNAHNIQYYTTSKVTEAGELSVFIQDDCDESGGGGIIIKGLSVGDGIEIVEDTDTEILLEEFELAELTDAGNTMLLLNETETMSEENSIAVAENIAELDGYISDEVATTYIQNTSGNDFAKANALLENSPLPSSVQSELDNMEMNPALKNVVKQEQVGINSRDAKRMKIAELKQFRGLVINEMVISVMSSESTDEDMATLIQFLQNDNNLQSKFHLVDISCKMQNFESAKANLETILQMIQSEDMQYIAEMEDYIELQAIMIDIESGAIELEDAIENNLELINFIAENEDYPGELTAQLLLDEAGIRDYEELIRLPEPSMNNKNASVENKETFITESYDDIINIYPNPTSENIYIEYAFLNSSNDHYIEIYGIKGNLIDRIELTQSVGLFTYSKTLAAGNYIIKVGEKYSQKITVQ